MELTSTLLAVTKAEALLTGRQGGKQISNMKYTEYFMKYYMEKLLVPQIWASSYARLSALGQF